MLVLFNALLEMEPRADPRDVRDRAEAMAALAVDFEIPIGEIEQNWIRFRREKDRTLSAFTRWCVAVRELREATHTCLKMCPRCHAQPAQRITDQLFFCTACGGVVE